MLTLGFCSLLFLIYIFLSWIRRYIRVDKYNEKYILVTGCDSGFGQLLVQKLDMLGFNVFATCLTESAQRRLREITSSRLMTLTLDITNKDQVRFAVDKVRAALPHDKGLWGLVNNAGINGNCLGPPEWLTTEEFERITQVNTMGTVRVTLAFLPVLKKGQGRVIFMSSMSGRLANPFNLAYCMSKASVESFADGLRAHLNLFNVSVHIVEPGAFQTNLVANDSIKKAVAKAWESASRMNKEDFGREYFENFEYWMMSTISRHASPNLNKVINSYIHSLTARCPRTRYTVGIDAHLFYLPLSYMPSFIQDFAFSRMTANLVPAVLQGGGPPNFGPEERRNSLINKGH